ncbi:MAG: ATP-binding protein [Eubacteriales bacterium]|nr:ATP-binding protein [Eubacteriales bacterium]
MLYISRIEIQYFRSIYMETITDLHDLNVLTGKNDVGKSNVLKALNLFFNNCTDSDTPFLFERDYNKRRLREVRSESVKGKQFITIKVTFLRGERAEKTLPKKFTVTKKWFRYDERPSVTESDIERLVERNGGQYNDRNKASLTSFLNKIRYIYVPAIKDDSTFRSTFSLLRESIYNDTLSNSTVLLESLETLSNSVSEAASELNAEFQDATGIRSYLTSPKTISDLYQSISVDTDMEGTDISLNLRGDGIRVRYLPSILHYISLNSSNLYIWGFEEPENSLEYNLALSMAEDFQDRFSEGSNIFLTSHSPAFIGLETSEYVQVYRCFRDDKGTCIKTLNKAKDQPELCEELGYVNLQKEIFELYNAKVIDYKLRLEKLGEREEEISLINKQLEQATKPTLFTEGITDVLILKTAWKALYDNECPFEIKSCNTLLEQDDVSAAGCGKLADLLCSSRPDNPNFVIGLFDRDKEGIKSYELDRNFEKKDECVKMHRNKRCCAICLPVLEDRKQFAENDNLCIEFYFDNVYLTRTIEEKSLILIPQPFRTLTPSGKVQSTSLPAEGQYEFYKIDNSTKKYFAEKIVPTFEQVAFFRFEGLFKIILDIIQQFA